jgi:hypothetical protein
LRELFVPALAQGGHTPEEFAAFLKKELSYWAQMIREAKIEKQ